jgi:hypothetical protein
VKTSQTFQKWGLRKLKEKIRKLTFQLGKRRNKAHQSVDNQRIAQIEVVDAKTENVSDDSKGKHLAERETIFSQNDATQFATLYNSEFMVYFKINKKLWFKYSL